MPAPATGLRLPINIRPLPPDPIQEDIKRSFQDIGKNLQNLASSKQQFQQQLQLIQQQQKFKLQSGIALAKEKARLEQSDPFSRALKVSKFGQALNLSGMNFQDVNISPDNVKSFIQTGEFGTNQEAKPITQPQVQPQVESFGQFQTQPTFRDQQAQQPLARQEDLIITKLGQEISPFGEKRIVPKEIFSQQGIINKGLASEAVKVSGKQLENLIKTSGNLSRVENAFSGLVAQAKRAVNEQGGFSATAAIKARGKRFLQRTFGFGDASPEDQFGGLAGFDAQRQETILALSPILTNANRILRSALVMLRKTTPDLPIFGTTEAEFAANIKQSLKNAFKLSLGVARGLLTPEQIIDLEKNATNDRIDAFMQNLLNKTRFTAEDEKTFNLLFQRVIETPASTPEVLFAPGEAKFGKQSQRFGGKQTKTNVDVKNQISDIDKQLAELDRLERGQ